MNRHKQDEIILLCRHYDGDERVAELRAKFPAQSTWGEVLEHVYHFIRGMGYVVPHGELVILENGELVVERDEFRALQEKADRYDDMIAETVDKAFAGLSPNDDEAEELINE